MGKGLALEFRFRVPEMYYEYKEKCGNNELTIGRYWIYDKENRIDRKILNFPTKRHFAHPSKIEYIKAGLEYFRMNYEADGIETIAFPVLGSRNGKLDYREVYDIMKQYLSDLPIYIEIYVNNTRQDSFTQSVAKIISDAPHDFLQAELGFSSDLVSELKQHIKDIQNLSDLINYRSFNIERIQRIYDLGFRYLGKRILI